MTILAVHIGEDWPQLVEVPEGRDFHHDIERYPGYSEADSRWLAEWLVEECGYGKVEGVVWVEDSHLARQRGEHIHPGPEWRV